MDDRSRPGEARGSVATVADPERRSVPPVERRVRSRGARRGSEAVDGGGLRLAVGDFFPAFGPQLAALVPKGSPAIDVVGSARTLEDFGELVDRARPDVTVVSEGLLETAPAAVLRETVDDALARTRLVVLGEADDSGQTDSPGVQAFRRRAADFLDLGVSAYLPRSTELWGLVAVIRSVGSDFVVVPRVALPPAAWRDAPKSTASMDVEET